MKTWKKILGAALSLSLLTACGGGGGTTSSAPPTSAAPTKEAGTATSSAPEPNANAGAEVKTVESGKLIMSTNAKFPPYEMVSTDGESFEGIDVEVAGAIADKLGLELVVDDMDFDAALLAVQNGKSDIVMAGVSVTPGRSAVMDFSDTYATGVQVIIVTENSTITKVEDLAQVDKIGTQTQTTGFLYCSEDYGDEHVTAYDDGATAVQALLNGQVDCVVIDNAPAQEYVKANPGLKILDTEFANEDYAIGMQKGNTALLEAVNSTLKELTTDGTIPGIIEKYIPSNGGAADSTENTASGQPVVAQ